MIRGIDVQHGMRVGDIVPNNKEGFRACGRFGESQSGGRVRMSEVQSLETMRLVVMVKRWFS